MNIPLTPGTKYLLDRATEVIVLKSSTRSNSSYNVELPGRSVETVERERLTPLTQSESIRVNVL